MKSKVSIVKCKSYHKAELKPAVENAFGLLGGIASFVKKGEKVLVKPNMLSGRSPEDGVNTHIEVVRAVVRLVKKAGAYPIIGDNPSASLKPKQVYESSGMASIAREEGIELAEFKGVKIVQGFPISSYFFESDKIISIPKMKTHVLTNLTGAIKNMFGSVSGLNKAQCHKKFPKPEAFKDVLVDVFGIVKPHISIMDGVIAMDGDGPSSGRLKNVGLLIASQDSVSVDAVFSHLVGVDPFSILTTKEAYKRGLGEARLENIEILGEKLGKGFVKGFKLPHSSILNKLPEKPIKFLMDFIKFNPYIMVKECKKCNICAETCPVSAITISPEISKIDYTKCVRCMCCHEVCPYKAVHLKRNILARVLGI